MILRSLSMWLVRVFQATLRRALKRAPKTVTRLSTPLHEGSALVLKVIDETW